MSFQEGFARCDQCGQNDCNCDDDETMNGHTNNHHINEPFESLVKRRMTSKEAIELGYPKDNRKRRRALRRKSKMMRNNTSSIQLSISRWAYVQSIRC